MAVKKVYKKMCECGEPNIFALHTDGKHVASFMPHCLPSCPGPQCPPRRIPLGHAIIED